MVLKSVHMKLKTDEVPIRFLKDREGRLSHHKRSGWFSPWAAAWINLRAMFVYGADFFLFWPGVVLAVFGAALTLPLTFGPLTIGPITFSLYWMLLGLTSVTAGPAVHLHGDHRADLLRLLGRDHEAVVRPLPVHAHRAPVGGRVHAGDRASRGPSSRTTSGTSFSSFRTRPVNHFGVTGLLLMIAGFMTFTFTLLLHSTAVVVWRRP